MGQNHSLSDTIPCIDEVRMQIIRHTKVLTEINLLTYDDFKNCLDNLNALSRKCIDQHGKQLVFLVKKGTDATILWKATVKIACIKADSTTKKVDTYKLLNLKQFLCVFRTFQVHLDTLLASEMHSRVRDNSSNHRSVLYTQNAIRFPTDIIFKNTNNNTNKNCTNSATPLSSSSLTCSQHNNDHADECSICLERNTEVILPCTHSFCVPCIEQWNVDNKACPICSASLLSMEETWVKPNLPAVEEINEKIYTEFINLVK